MSDRYTVGKMPRGELVYKCCLECYKYLDPEIYKRLKKHKWLYIKTGNKYTEYEEWDGVLDGFKPAYVPSFPVSTGYSRWWVRYGMFVYDGQLGATYIGLSKIAISEHYVVEKIAIKEPGAFKSYPASAGSLTGAELPVVRRRDGYLRVGSWLAWHRVLGTLDDGRWVLIGDDGLYEAVFTATVERPLETFGEVGYVRVVGPYVGDVDLVQSPCGAPRLVACGEEGVKVARALLEYVRGVLAGWGVVPDLFVPSSWSCSRPFVIPELAELDIPNWVVLDWPLADPCPPVLLAMSQDPLGLLTDATCHTCWD
ncbi:hypothetical protein ODS41_12775 [Pyrobaculum sp. 3827-6]|uniref:hypothetical protein n=1 Tax=Pyrobaculum sp. 3827-6 TaxID=2983604 RepID=UPI0021D89033|nr:hypothetical protein [Pyrobaculum sp. 3827-6]MCU7788788.1 hypothetical protein [Pyrobaculum sp. 3827-6]